MADMVTDMVGLLAITHSSSIVVSGFEIVDLEETVASEAGAALEVIVVSAVASALEDREAFEVHVALEADAVFAVVEASGAGAASEVGKT